MLIVIFRRIEAVGIGRVHPPRIRTIIIEFTEIFPIDIASHRTEGIIDLHSRRIVLHWRPDVRDTTLRPRLERHQQSFLVEFTELLRHRSETCPNGNHEVGMFLMYVLYQLLTVGKVFRQEVHRIPQVIGAPILPILNDTVKRHLQGTILVDDTLRFSSGLITLFRLPEAIGPEWEHRHITREMAHLGYHTIGTATIHEIIVNTLAYQRSKGHSFGVIVKLRG